MLEHKSLNWSQSTYNYSKLTQWVLYIPWVSVLLLLFFQAQFAATLERYGFFPLLIGIVFLGLPHGALDHLVPTRMGFKWAQKPVVVSLYLLAYMAVAGLFFALWFWQPILAFVLFLLASILHWGQGDMRFLEIFLNRLPSSPWGTVVTILLRGSLPILLPVLAFPQTAESLFQNMSMGLGVERLITISPQFVSSGIIFLLALSVLYMLNAVLVSDHWDTLVIDGLELVLLVILFTTIPAYFSLGIYFLFWHSLRHLLRLLTLKESDQHLISQGKWLGTSLRLARDLTPVTVLALAFLAILYVFAESRIASTESFVALYLILISALTMPHLFVVALMDQKPVLKR